MIVSIEYADGFRALKNAGIIKSYLLTEKERNCLKIVCYQHVANNSLSKTQRLNFTGSNDIILIHNMLKTAHLQRRGRV